MRKIYALLPAVFFFFNLYSQSIDSLRNVDSIPYPGISGHVAPDGACDSLNLFAANSWPAYYYEYRGGGSILGVCNLSGLAVGTDTSKILENANFFDVSADHYNYITGAYIYFAFANSDDSTQMKKDVVFKVYDDAGGQPGTSLASVSKTLDQIHQDVLAGKMTEIFFKSAVPMPASKKFYISIDVQGFNWGPVRKDSIAIVATPTPPSVYQFLSSTTGSKKWVAVDTVFQSNNQALNVSLFVFPFVSKSLTTCAVLPVSMFNFGGTIKNYEAYLNWSTAMESNNKGFYIERSNDGRNFTSIGFVAGAGNSTQIKNYSFTDGSLKDINVSTTYYRLKQVDNDGQFSYSQVLALSLQNIASKLNLYPNPAKDVTTIETNLDVASKVEVRVVTANGKVVEYLDKGVLNPGLQQIYINTSNLAKGSYIVQLTVGDNHYSQMMVKE
jgi:hypothetical protein